MGIELDEKVGSLEKPVVFFFFFFFLCVCVLFSSIRWGFQLTRGRVSILEAPK